MSYYGPNRRIHRVFVTRNTEYHLRREVCVGVRDRCSGDWLDSHMAIQKPLCGAIRFDQGSVMPNTGQPKVGESLYFHDDNIDVVTSTLIAVERPPKSIVEYYAA